MENIDIDPLKEMQHLESMYKHYKILYRKFLFLCCSDQRKIAKEKRDEYKQKIQRVIEERCKNV